jgi:predicted acylesterase/phospholipase RssA
VERSLSFLRSARRIGLVLSGGSVRCAFQVGVLEELRSLGIQPALCVAVSAGVWNGAAVAVDAVPRLRYYWRCFARMRPLRLGNLLSERTPFRYPEMHRRTFGRYIDPGRLVAPEALPLWVGVTRLADRRPALFEVREVPDPLPLLLASNYLPPFFGQAPSIRGERYGDGGWSDNIPYEKALAEGCDALVVVTMKGESEGELYKSPQDVDHRLPSSIAERAVIVRPRHRMPVAFTERRWPILERMMDLGRLRAREVLLGESHPETEWKARGLAPTVVLAKLRQPWKGKASIKDRVVEAGSRD